MDDIILWSASAKGAFFAYNVLLADEMVKRYPKIGVALITDEVADADPLLVRHLRRRGIPHYSALASSMGTTFSKRRKRLLVNVDGTHANAKQVDQVLNVFPRDSVGLEITVHSIVYHDDSLEGQLPDHSVVGLLQQAEVLYTHSDFVRQQLNDLSVHGKIIAHSGWYGSYSPLRESYCQPAWPFSLPQKYALLFGYLESYKGLSCLVDSWTYVRSHADDALPLVIAGPCNSDSIREGLRALETIGRVVFIEKYLNHDEIIYLLCAASFVVLPYLHITQSANAAAALSLGVPILASDLMNWRTALNGNVTFFSIDSDLQQNFARAYIQLSRNTPPTPVNIAGLSWDTIVSNVMSEKTHEI